MINIPSHQLDLATLATALEVLGQQHVLSQTYWSEKAQEARSIIKALDTFPTWSNPTTAEIRNRLDALAGVCESLTDAGLNNSQEGQIFWHDRCQLILGLADLLTDQILAQPKSPASSKKEPATH